MSDIQPLKDGSWEAVKAAKSGDVFVDRFDEGLRFIIMRGPFHLCAYVGIPIHHPLAGHSYDDLPVNVHGGLTFGKEGDGKYHPAGYYWYGWDYGHCDDYMISESHISSYEEMNETRTKWDVLKVNSDSWSALYDFRKLLKLTEAVLRKNYLAAPEEMFKESR